VTGHQEAPGFDPGDHVSENIDLCLLIEINQYVTQKGDIGVDL
jgi:hypothetical protein